MHFPHVLFNINSLGHWSEGEGAKGGKLSLA